MGKESQKRTSIGERVAMVGLAVAVTVCCAALLLFGTAGLGFVLAVAFSPWFLVPTAFLLVGIVAWYGRRRHPSTKAPVGDPVADRTDVGA